MLGVAGIVLSASLLFIGGILYELLTFTRLVGVRFPVANSRRFLWRRGFTVAGVRQQNVGEVVADAVVFRSGVLGRAARFGFDFEHRVGLDLHFLEGMIG